MNEATERIVKDRIRVLKEYIEDKEIRIAKYVEYITACTKECDNAKSEIEALEKDIIREI